MDGALSIDLSVIQPAHLRLICLLLITNYLNTNLPTGTSASQQMLVIGSVLFSSFGIGYVIGCVKHTKWPGCFDGDSWSLVTESLQPDFTRNCSCDAVGSTLSEAESAGLITSEH